MRAYVDSDVLIWHLRGNRTAKGFLRRLARREDTELWVGAMQRAEVVFFMRPEEADRTCLLLSQFKTAPVDEEIVDIAGTLYRKWNPSHGTDINDALLAATVLKTGGNIFCLNRKHYPMPGVAVQRAW
ncbi:MAG: PIN domain-containing protein [Candidatus Hydrogenedentes bacterium]|nr:PIN domain-containing protein [Candidatus Hydrogenedentota bacterium]